MRGDAARQFPVCYLSVFPSELDPAKTSLSARLVRLFLIITSIPQRSARIHKPSPYLAHSGNNHHRISHQRNRSNVTGRTSWQSRKIVVTVTYRMRRRKTRDKVHQQAKVIDKRTFCASTVLG